MVVDIDPVIFSLGPLQVRWYGLMYVLSFIMATYLAKHLAKKGFFHVIPDKVDSLVTHFLIGMFLGARIFYVFIYNWGYYSKHLAEVFAVWQGGLSFHGALTGIVLAIIIFARKNNLTFYQVGDVVALSGCQGLFLGRMGNFINGELYGRPTNFFTGMIFPNGGPNPRHPSQLYEGIAEGIILPLILWFLYKRVKNYGYIAGTFIMGYGIFRYFIEFFREPDTQLGYYFGGTTTMGQILCFIMVIIGLGVIFLASRKKEKITLKVS